MFRVFLVAIAIVSGCAGCGAGPDSSVPSSSAADGAALRPAQDSERPEITPAKISKDVVGRAVEVSALSGAGPRDKWTFEAGEFRRIDILERHPTKSGLDLLVFMLSRSIPKPGETQVQVSGQLRLRYEWKGTQWVLRSIENVNFRYSVGVAT
jgi:hypothetical protein